MDIMDTKFVKVRFEVRCKWEGFPPSYRIYVNGEMFTERSFKWNTSTYIKEMLQVEAVPGIYKFRLEELDPKNGKFEISKPYIQVGEAKMINEDTFEIL